jgi:hypothetical protein
MPSLKNPVLQALHARLDFDLSLVATGPGNFKYPCSGACTGSWKTSAFGMSKEENAILIADLKMILV